MFLRKIGFEIVAGKIWKKSFVCRDTDTDFLKFFEYCGWVFMNTPWEKIKNRGFTSFRVSVIVTVSVPKFPAMNTLIYTAIMFKINNEIYVIFPNI